MVQFMHALRGLLRSSIGACIITFPAHLHSAETVKKVENLADYVVRLESFDGMGKFWEKLKKFQELAQKCLKHLVNMMVFSL